MNLFGYTISKDKKSEKLDAFELETNASTDVVGAEGAGVVAFNYNLASMPENEAELIRTYRRMSMSPDIDLALTEIKNEVFVFDIPGRRAVNLAFYDDSKLSSTMQKKISDEFVEIYNIIDFDANGLVYFMDWYIDGRLYLHKVIDTSKPKNGIQKVIPVDSLKMKKIREIPKVDRDGIYNANEIHEYYIFMDNPFLLGGSQSNMSSMVRHNQGLKIQKDSISYSDSGVFDKQQNHAVSHLYKAIVPLNNLRMMEDSLLIYRVSRAPERRIIYVDVGNLPKTKAEEYVRDLMNRFKNKLVYDSKTGSIADRKNVLSMIEDYWLPRREGARGTEISTLPGGENLGIVEDVNYFRSKLYQSLNVPMSRLREDQHSAIFARASELSRDESRFKKFIDRLRQRFMILFEDMLRTQLILKKIIGEDDWDNIQKSIQWEYAEDNNFVEIKESEVLNNRINSLSQIDPFLDKYFTREWIMKNVLRMSDSDVQLMIKTLGPIPTNEDDNTKQSVSPVEFDDSDVEEDSEDERLTLK